MNRRTHLVDRALDVATVLLCMPWSDGAPPRDVGLCAGDLTTAALKYWQEKDGSPAAMRGAVLAMTRCLAPIVHTDDRLPVLLERLHSVLAELPAPVRESA